MRIEHAIEIDAPPAVVWAVTEDVERWPEWTPTVTRITREDGGPFAAGSTARIKQPGMAEAVWTVTELVRGERFAWTAALPGLRFRATHELSPHDGGTRNVLRLDVSGWLAVLMSPLLRRKARQALERENAGLKARCEDTAATT